MGLSQSELTNAPMAQIMVAVPCFCWARTAGGICGGAVSAKIVGGMGAKQFDYPSQGGRASYHFHKILFIKPNTINIWLAVETANKNSPTRALLQIQFWTPFLHRQVEYNTCVIHVYYTDLYQTIISRMSLRPEVISQ